MIIGLHGTARSGKNTVSSYLEDKYGYEQESFASPLKEAVIRYTGAVSNNEDDREDKQEFSIRKDHIHAMAKFFGFNRRIGEFYFKFKEEFSQYQVGETDATLEYKMSYREVLQTLGTNVARELNEDVWVNMLSDRIKGKVGSIVITDVRFDNEAEYITSNGGRVFSVSREGKSTLKEGTANHESEGGISEEYVSGALDNNGTLEELYQGVEKELDKLFEERASPYKEGLQQ